MFQPLLWHSKDELQSRLLVLLSDLQMNVRHDMAASALLLTPGMDRRNVHDIVVEDVNWLCWQHRLDGF